MNKYATRGYFDGFAAIELATLISETDIKDMNLNQLYLD